MGSRQACGQLSGATGVTALWSRPPAGQPRLMWAPGEPAEVPSAPEMKPATGRASLLLRSVGQTKSRVPPGLEVEK